MKEVVITGLGFVLPNCDDRATFWRHVRDGECQLTLEADPADPKTISAMGRIRGFDAKLHLKELPERYYARLGRAQQLYIASLLRAMDDSGLKSQSIARDRAGLFDGTARDNFDFWVNRLEDRAFGALGKHDLARGLPGMSVGLAAAMFGVRGPTYTYAGACSAGAIALGAALRELRDDAIDIAFATGHDSALLPPVYEMYRDASLLSTERDDASRAIRPYDGSKNNAFGEGAVTIALETREHAERRGAPIIAVLGGYRFGNAGFHPTHVERSGQRPAELILELLEREGVALDDVGFVIGHGNGVLASDQSELAYMQRVFGADAADVPLLSTKPIYGHTLGASATLSIAAAALMLHHQRVGHIGGRDVTNESGRRCEAALVVSYGMGGQNAVVLLRRDPEATPSRRAA